ncbi:helix-turn-helix domain-containing protein [Paenibacillus sp. DMB20]|uniref:helix-turn-helix domain-containing protein n=1 Tax=Paenibacillus sp. DMB20 TaxID=1642570 RepID=UPI001F2C3DEB|nr:helix-turn-helix transcriptional regulator [Paenibacillus sp. DMB20]
MLFTDNFHHGTIYRCNTVLLKGENHLKRVSRGRCLLSYLLAARGINQSEYALRSGRSQRMISHFCNNERVMLPEDMYTASRILNCRMEDLYEWIEQDAD